MNGLVHVFVAEKILSCGESGMLEFKGVYWFNWSCIMYFSAPSRYPYRFLCNFAKGPLGAMLSISLG